MGGLRVQDLLVHVLIVERCLLTVFIQRGTLQMRVLLMVGDVEPSLKSDLSRKVLGVWRQETGAQS